MHVVDLGAQFGAADITDPHDGTVGINPNGNVGKLFRGRKHVLDDDGGVQTLAFDRRRPPN